MRTYDVRAYNSDPQQCVTSADLAAVIADDLCEKLTDRAAAQILARNAVKFGYWVEVFNEDGELIAGPFDPDNCKAAEVAL